MVRIRSAFTPEKFYGIAAPEHSELLMPVEKPRFTCKKILFPYRQTVLFT